MTFACLLVTTEKRISMSSSLTIKIFDICKIEISLWFACDLIIIFEKKKIYTS